MVLAYYLMVVVVFVGDGCILKDIFGSHRGCERGIIITMALVLLFCVFDMILLDRCRERVNELCGRESRWRTYRGLTEWSAGSLNANERARHK